MDLKQEAFADEVEVSRSYLANMERGHSPIPDDLIEKITKRYQVNGPKGFTASDVGPRQETKADTLVYIPYAGVVPASDWGDPLHTQDRKLKEAKYAGKNRFLCTVVGDSCEPSLQSGDETLWEAQRGGEPHGLIVIAEREIDHACTVKQYKKERGKDRLIPINKDYDEPTAADGFHIAAYLVGVFRTAGIERSWYYPGGLRPENLQDPQAQLDLYQELRGGQQNQLMAAEPKQEYPKRKRA